MQTSQIKHTKTSMNCQQKTKVCILGECEYEEQTVDPDDRAGNGCF